ncbi:MAG: hypothetical protein QOK31_1551 [Solirubrobacteraceae bacterium]|nr:hypothetical protein [Solirubrobacteraceae bacterium]
MVNRRPRLTLLGTSASPAEAAAVIAAVERFMRDNSPPAAPPAQRANPWLRTARLESVDCLMATPPRWGDAHPWGRRGP